MATRDTSTGEAKTKARVREARKARCHSASLFSLCKRANVFSAGLITADTMLMMGQASKWCRD